MAKHTEHDVPGIKQAASGRWAEILATLGHLPAEILDGKGHPCPKCGGHDRFRFTNQGDGGSILCNQCPGGKKMGDGIASLAWATGEDFPTVAGKLSDYLGVPPIPSANGDGKRKKKEYKPDDHLAWKPWSPVALALWILRKPGMTVESIQAAGGRLARYSYYADDLGRYETNVLALPIYSPPQLSAGEPTGYIVWNICGDNSGRLPKISGSGKEKKTEWVKMKVTLGSKSGLTFFRGLEQIAPNREPRPEVVWKTAGPTDAMALWTIIPPELRDRHIIVTNSCGENENIKVAWAEVFRGHRVHIIHDADDTGDIGAAKWIKALVGIAAEVRHVRLPFFELTGDGKPQKDVRDFVSAGHSYAELLAAADATAPADPNEIEGAIERQICSSLCLDVLGEHPGGEIVVFASHDSRRKTDWIKDIDRLKYSKLIQITGPPAIDQVDESGQDRDKHTMPAVRNAIAYLAGRQRLNDHSLSGPGCWQALSERGDEVPGVVVVGAGEAALWDGQNLTKITRPIAGGRLLELSSSAKWYEFNQLSCMLQQVTPEFSRQTLAETEALFGRWRWRFNRESPTIMAGLVTAAWVQTLWAWRPHVAVVGDTQTGKSTLFEALDGIYGLMAEKSSKSTAAGIRQKLQGSGRIPLCDEFEKHANRQEILEMIRASSRGDKIFRGTQHQKATESSLRHIFWIAAIEVGLRRIPDRNRFIQLELVPPLESDRGKLCCPPTPELHRLGQRLLAIAIHSLPLAKPLAIRLKAFQVPGVDPRAIESYAVPAAILAVARGMTDTQAEQILRAMVVTAPQEDQQMSDQEDILQAIFRAVVTMETGNDTKTVVSHNTVARLWEMLPNPEALAALERHGITQTSETKKQHAEGGERFCFIDHRDVCEKLLRNSEWSEQSIDQILKRIPNAEISRRRIGARRTYGVLIPAKFIDSKISGIDERENSTEVYRAEF